MGNNAWLQLLELISQLYVHNEVLSTVA